MIPFALLIGGYMAHSCSIKHYTYVLESCFCIVDIDNEATFDKAALSATFLTQGLNVRVRQKFGVFDADFLTMT